MLAFDLSQALSMLAGLLARPKRYQYADDPHNRGGGRRDDRRYPLRSHLGIVTAAGVGC